MVLSMERWVGKVAIVTGASAGIGACIVESLVKEGVKVVGFARRKVKLEILANKLQNEKGKLYAVKADVSNEEEVLNAFKWIKENVGPVHILINNAAVTLPNAMLRGDAEQWRKMFETNVIGLSVVTREAINDMKANNVDGHIIHINSLLGHHIVNFPMNIYPATKFAVTALAEMLRLELMREKSKIKISDISPGLVKSNFGEEAEKPFRTSDIYKLLVKEKQILDPEDVADSVIYALSTPPHVQIQELRLRPVWEGVFDSNAEKGLETEKSKLLQTS